MALKHWLGGSMQILKEVTFNDRHCSLRCKSHPRLRKLREQRKPKAPLHRTRNIPKYPREDSNYSTAVSMILKAIRARIATWRWCKRQALASRAVTGSGFGMVSNFILSAEWYAHMKHRLVVHLQSYSDENDFYRIYDAKYAEILQKARNFFSQTDATPEKSLVIISAGFDACVHEYPSMQRHGKHVPPSFYHCFAQDTVALADEVAQGKVISVLEGGYSDRALTSGALAHIAGLTLEGDDDPAVEWWQTPQLITLEKACKKLATGNPSQAVKRKPDSSSAWLQGTMHAFSALRAHLPGYTRPTGQHSKSLQSTAVGRTLRARNVRSTRPESGSEASATPPSKGKMSTAPASEPSRRTWRSIQEDSPLSTPMHGASEEENQLGDPPNKGRAHAAEDGSSTPQERAAEEALALQLDTMSLKAPQ